MHHNYHDEEKSIDEVSRNRISCIQIASSWMVHARVIAQPPSSCGRNIVDTVHYPIHDLMLEPPQRCAITHLYYGIDCIKLFQDESNMRPHATEISQEDTKSIPYFRVSHTENYVIHYYLALHGGSRLWEMDHIVSGSFIFSNIFDIFKKLWSENMNNYVMHRIVCWFPQLAQNHIYIQTINHATHFYSSVGPDDVSQSAFFTSFFFYQTLIVKSLLCEWNRHCVAKTWNPANEHNIVIV